MIESSRMMGSGYRTPLKFNPNFNILSGSPSVSLFPGMVLAARGRNGAGGWFSISDVIDVGKRHYEIVQSVVVLMVLSRYQLHRKDKMQRQLTRSQ